MSQSTDDLTRSELRAIRGHYRRRVYIAFRIPALIAVALGWLLFQDQDAQSGEPSQAAPRTTVSGPITNEVVSKNCVAALQEASTMLDRAAQALKDWRLHAKALIDYRAGEISLAEARQRWDETTKVGLAGADRFDKQAEVYKKAATTCNRPPPTLDRLGQLACGNADGCFSALPGNAPSILSSATAWCCANPPTASTGHSSYLPRPRR